MGKFAGLRKEPDFTNFPSSDNCLSISVNFESDLASSSSCLFAKGATTSSIFLSNILMTFWLTFSLTLSLIVLSSESNRLSNFSSMASSRGSIVTDGRVTDNWP